MQFTSVLYLLFVALCVIVYYALPSVRSRRVWLLLASLGFYYLLSARWTLVLLAVTAIGYVGGLVLQGAGLERAAKRRRAVLVAALAVVTGVLFYFKYAAFSATAGNLGLEYIGVEGRLPVLSIALPIGVSFWTFQTIAYLVDVYKGTLAAERNPVTYATFIGFFPHVTAGPIARGGQLLPQLEKKHAFSHENVRAGLQLIAWGFFKKLVVADPLGVIVNTVFSQPRAYSQNGTIMLGASVAFAIQIYCDFAGYTDIARGSARLFGVDLMPNFSAPYLSRSVKEFWRRWHMTLMSWLKDYIYIPLGGSRVPTWRKYTNVMIVFLISGLWHGAGWTFIVWGALNGAYQIAGDLTAGIRSRTRALIGLAEDNLLVVAFQTAFTFALVTIAWVFFRAQSLGDALYIVRTIATGNYVRPPLEQIVALGLSAPVLVATGLGALVVLGADVLSTRIDIAGSIARLPLPLRWLGYQAVIVAVVVFGYYGPLYKAADFAYFKF